MVSVVIATSDSERVLVPTLAALVPATVAGIVREVIVADAGSQDETAAVADVAGCRFLLAPGTRGARLKAGAAAARAPWLLFLRPGLVLDPSFADEVDRFIRGAGLGMHAPAAVLQWTGSRSSSPVVQALALLAGTLAKRPRPEQGLLISKQSYDALGGHRADTPNAEADLLRRLGRRRITVLRTGARMSGS